MNFIVTTCQGREHLLPPVIEQLPEAIINFDNFTDCGKFQSTAWFNYQRSWLLAGDDSCVQMDDDIILTNDFKTKILDAIAMYPNYVIQFFSMRIKDLTIGTRIEHGSTFMMQQCYYLPKGIAKGIYEYSKKFYFRTEHTHCPTDICIAEYFKKHDMNYIIWCPNLVDHIGVQSKINKKRTSKRQSKTFKAY